MTRNGHDTLLRQLQQGGAIAPDAMDKSSLANATQELGMTLLVADCDRARSRSAVLRAIVKAVDFPEFFGGNLDALYDCLCDTVLDQKVGAVLWLERLHSGDPALEEDAGAIEAVCADAAEFARENGRQFCYVIEHAGRHPDPEPGVAAAPYGEA
ncbi:barstar family protein 2 [Bordetella trematum]|uniref:Ribonuclease inhibitor n=1 Tax=Bordetella trematum TaxID=123899 RepID=A0A157NUB0_9BORD|nr:barstar family protein [Bordetella trematum]AUL46372.1 barstar family protein 2 [Bordetella trematum]AZR93142.1 barstar family protein 2 [Bordetella trematum]NNH21419.1 barstar family protein [Bordetella trematum]QIM71746.1 barstar family protein 2 [Bordetella trematum]SAI24942.1 ribonuclease inhibitor [Bordetella trematum]